MFLSFRVYICVTLFLIYSQFRYAVIIVTIIVNLQVTNKKKTVVAIVSVLQSEDKFAPYVFFNRLPTIFLLNFFFIFLVSLIKKENNKFLWVRKGNDENVTVLAKKRNVFFFFSKPSSALIRWGNFVYKYMWICRWRNGEN